MAVIEYVLSSKEQDYISTLFQLVENIIDKKSNELLEQIFEIVDFEAERAAEIAPQFVQTLRLYSSALDKMKASELYSSNSDFLSLLRELRNSSSSKKLKEVCLSLENTISAGQLFLKGLYRRDFSRLLEVLEKCEKNSDTILAQWLKAGKFLEELISGQRKDLALSVVEKLLEIPEIPVWKVAIDWCNGFGKSLEELADSSELSSRAMLKKLHINPYIRQFRKAESSGKLREGVETLRRILEEVLKDSVWTDFFEELDTLSSFLEILFSNSLSEELRLSNLPEYPDEYRRAELLISSSKKWFSSLVDGSLEGQLVLLQKSHREIFSTGAYIEFIKNTFFIWRWSELLFSGELSEKLQQSLKFIRELTGEDQIELLIYSFLGQLGLEPFAPSDSFDNSKSLGGTISAL